MLHVLTIYRTSIGGDDDEDNDGDDFDGDINSIRSIYTDTRYQVLVY